MWLVLKIVEDFNSDSGLIPNNLIKLHNPNIGLLGLCPVFETKEQALKLFPNVNVVEIKFKIRS